MIALVGQRQRVVKVRKIQHGLAAGAAVEAANRVTMLEMNQARLARMRGELQPAEGPTTGAALARMGELAMRLDAARHGLGPTIETARSFAASLKGEQHAARRDQESAEKLEQAAIGLAEELAERRLQQNVRRIGRANQGEQE
jgi:hypothetical protein